MSKRIYTHTDIADIVKGTVLQENSSNPVKYLLIDSRQIIDSGQSVFFAIQGERWHGHQFLQKVYNKGVRNFIVDKAVDLSLLAEANIIQVNNTIQALQLLSTYHRKQFNLPVIGITGSNGKTVVKEWLYHLLNEDYHIVRNPKSYNSQVGVPLSVWPMEETHSLGIFEAGISQPDEMSSLQKIIQPNIGIITNIGPPHSEGFLNIRQKVNEKLNLFSNVKVLIYCKDHHDINESIAAVQTHLESLKLFSWSSKSEADLKITQITKKRENTVIEAVFNKQTLKILIPFNDDASVENAIHCWSLLLYLDCKQKIIEERMRTLTKVAMRLELKEAVNNCSLINDSYNSDLGSLSIALDFLNQQQQHTKKTLILSDILQSGSNAEELYQKVGELLHTKGVNRLIGIGEQIIRQKNKFVNNKLELDFYTSTEDFINTYAQIKFSNESILIKGARAFKFEQISNLLEKKIHTTILEINLNVLVENLNYFRTKIQPATKIMAMVKAFSYGSGSYEIANILQFNNVDYLAVAFADEGVALRKAGIQLPVMVMNPERANFNTIISNQLEPEIFSLGILEAFEVTVQKNINAVSLPYPVHIKLDTGMHRLGFDKADVEELILKLKDNKYLKVQSVFSHLSASDNRAHDAFTKQQIKQFEDMSHKIIEALHYPVLRHILNSAGILRFSKAQFNMVRLGIGLYGVDTSGLIKNKLQNVGTLKTVIAQIKQVKKGESIGYNRKVIAKEDMMIGIANIGYADGLNMGLGNGTGSMLLKGNLVPIIGNICMDMCFLDITGVAAKEGDEAIIFGKKLSIEQLAKSINTIPYEILTGISQRVKRVYLYE